MTAYTASCAGDGRTPCDWHHDGPGSNAAAETHTETGHVTTTHVAGGPYEKARKA